MDEQGYIIGKSTGNMDAKGRIFIPSFSAFQNGTDILLKKEKTNEDNYRIKLIAFNKYLEIITRYKKLQETATAIEDYNKYEKIIEEIFRNIECICKIDNQGRINLPKQLLNDINWNPPLKVIYTGLGDSLEITKK